MQRASSKDICRLTEGDCLDSTALPTFTPDSKMGKLSCNPPFQTSNSCMQKMPLQCRLQSFYTEKLLLFL